MSDTPLEPQAPLGEEAPPRARTPWVTYAVLVVCVAIWAGIWFSGDPDSEEVLYSHGAASAWKIWDGAWWSLITSAFVHVDLIHLFFNMYWLWILGRPMERAVGSLRLFAFVVPAAFVSSALQLAVSYGAGIGFSGVIYALFGFMWIARRRYPAFLAVVTQQVAKILLVWLVFCFFLKAANILNIGNAAHVSGLAFGVLLGYVALPTPKRVLAVAAVAILLLASLVPPFRMPWSPYWATYKAVTAHYDDKLEEAIGWYRKVLELGAYDVEWTERQLAVVEARLAHQENRNEDAVRWYRRVIELDHEDKLAWAWSNIAIIQWFRDHKPDAAERSLVRMGALDEKAAEALRAAFHGDKAFDEERFEDAARLLQRSANLGEDLEWVHVQLVEVYGKLGDLEKRMLALKRLRELHPDAEVEPAPPPAPAVPDD